MDTKNNSIPVGPLVDDALYIERKADGELLHYVRSMQYVMLIEPRQQGKTSLIRHLITTFPFPEWIFIYIDISTLDTRSERGWYQTLCRRICADLKPVSSEALADIPQDSIEWRGFLSKIAGDARQVGKKIVLILDEIGGAKFDNNTSFFTTIRETYNTRMVLADHEFQNLSFILVGSFNPQDLIQDPHISPFNIAQQVHVSDFTVEQIRELMRKRGWEVEKAQNLSIHIHYWTGGHPYLAQMLCAYLNDDATASQVENAVERLRREDTSNLPHLIAQLAANDEMKEYARLIWIGEEKPFNPTAISVQRHLFLAGWIKADEYGNCTIRNHIYEQLVADLHKSSNDIPGKLVPPGAIANG